VSAEVNAAEAHHEDDGSDRFSPALWKFNLNAIPFVKQHPPPSKTKVVKPCFYASSVGFHAFSWFAIFRLRKT
jgi:hypothetical protein